MITFSQYRDDHSVTISIPDDLPIERLADAMRDFALALGYHPDNVKDELGEAH